MLDIVVVETASGWSILGAALAALAGVGGALIGAATIVLMEAWRRVLDGISASRLLRMELLRVTTTIKTILGGQILNISLVDPNWTARTAFVAPLLRESQLADIFREFSLLPDLQSQVEMARADPSYAANQTFIDNLERSYTSLHQVQDILEEVESKRPPFYLVRVLWARHERPGEDLLDVLGTLSK